MPRIHYPKGIGTSRVRGPKWPALPRPAAGCPFITKARETLTRRPGESSVSVSRVRRRPGRHSPHRPRRGGSHRLRFSQVASSSGNGSGYAVPKGLRSRGSTQGCFQRGSSCEPLPPRVPGHCQPPRPRFASRSCSSPSHLCGGLPRRFGLLNPRPTPLRTVQRLSMRRPSPTTSQVARGPAGPFRHPDDGDWLVQLSGPCSAL